MRVGEVAHCVVARVGVRVRVAARGGHAIFERHGHHARVEAVEEGLQARDAGRHDRDAQHDLRHNVVIDGREGRVGRGRGCGLDVEETHDRRGDDEHAEHKSDDDDDLFGQRNLHGHHHEDGDRNDDEFCENVDRCHADPEAADGNAVACGRGGGPREGGAALRGERDDAG